VNIVISLVYLKRKGGEYFLERSHQLYYEFVIQSCIDDFELSKKIRNQANSLGKDKIDKSLLYSQRLSMNNVAIYSALSLEAYANYYSSRYEIPFRNDVDRLSTVKKLNIFINWKNGKSLPNDVSKKVKNIFSLRDDFVHTKPEIIDKNTDDPMKGVQAKIEGMNRIELFNDLNFVYRKVISLDDEESKDLAKYHWIKNLRVE